MSISLNPSFMEAKVNLQKLIENYIKLNKVMQLATQDNDQPWIVTVNYVFDNKRNFYWLSLRDRQHSQNLRKNHKAAIAILSDPKIKQCLHVEGDAYELNGEEVFVAHNLYGLRYGQKDKRLDEAQSNDQTTRAYYVFTPRQFVLYDEINFPEQPRQVLNVSDFNKALAV